MPNSPDPVAKALELWHTNPPPTDRPVLLAGPTASGKSALALALAQMQNRVIINADALQVYDMWQILSARPAADEMDAIPHFLYGCVSRVQDWSVGHWLRNVRELLTQYPDAVIVGGTGLYFRALTEGLVDIPATPEAIRKMADAKLALEGLDSLRRDLDEPTRACIDLSNPARVQRAWEVLQSTGRGLVAWQALTPDPVLPLHATTPIILSPPVDWLKTRIDSRFAAMMAQGALEEVRTVLPVWDPRAPWAKAIGAPELIAHLQGHISLQAAVESATLATRQYAKRQRTWFRKRMKAWHALP